MADSPDVTAGADDAENAPKATTPAKPAVKPNAATVGLQRVIAEKDTTITSLKAELAALKGTPDAADEVATLKSELEQIRTERDVMQLKAEFPELVDVIDVAIAEDGKPPKKSLLAAMKARIGSSTTNENEEEDESRETSGVRNSPASRAKAEEDKFNDILKKAKLW